MLSDTHQPLRSGWLQSLRVRLFGEPDAVAEQLKEVAQQGRGLARLAHICAFGLIILFSLGSLVALSGDALASLAAQWGGGHLTPQAVPAAISLAVGVALVIAMDTGMLLAAATLRTLRSRRATWGDMSIHAAILTGVALIEASTYTYMAWRYDAPVNLPSWLLIIARACAAPILSVYLSMSAPSPISARDVLYQAEMAVGVGLIRDTVTIASDPQAPLARKMRLYRAASLMQPTDAARLDGMITAMQETEAAGGLPTALQDGEPTPVSAATQAASEGAVDVSGEHASVPDRPLPTGPGSPVLAPQPAKRGKTQRPAVLRLEPAPEARRASRKVASASAKVATGKAGAKPPVASYERLAREAWDGGARSIRAMIAATGMSRTTAQAWVRTFKGQASQPLTEALAEYAQ